MEDGILELLSIRFITLSSRFCRCVLQLMLWTLVVLYDVTSRSVCFWYHSGHQDPTEHSGGQPSSDHQQSGFLYQGVCWGWGWSVSRYYRQTDKMIKCQLIYIHFFMLFCVPFIILDLLLTSELKYHQCK